MMATIVNTLQAFLTPDVVLAIFGAVFQPTITMISRDFETFPEHRVTFYQLLLAFTTHCFNAYATLDAEQFGMVIDAVVWAFKHPIRPVAETGLRIMKTMLDKVVLEPEFAQNFFGRFYLSILQHLFSVATDNTHYSELDLHAVILAQLFYLVESNAVRVPLQQEDPSLDNTAFLSRFVSKILFEAFPHLQESQLQIIIAGFFPPALLALYGLPCFSRGAAGADCGAVPGTTRTRGPSRAICATFWWTARRWPART